jgi:hypothetical protein
MVQFIKNGQLIVENITQIAEYMNNSCSISATIQIKCHIAEYKGLKSSNKIKSVLFENLPLSLFYVNQINKKDYQIDLYLSKMKMGKKYEFISNSHIHNIADNLLIQIHYMNRISSFKSNLISLLDDFLLLTLTNEYFSIFDEFDLKLIID